MHRCTSSFSVREKRVTGRRERALKEGESGRDGDVGREELEEEKGVGMRVGGFRE